MDMAMAMGIPMAIGTGARTSEASARTNETNDRTNEVGMGMPVYVTCHGPRPPKSALARPMARALLGAGPRPEPNGP